MSVNAAHFKPLRALLYLVCAQVLFTLLDATGKLLARDMGIPLISLARHGGQLLLMAIVLGPSLGRVLIRTRHPWLQLLRGVVLSGFTLFFFTALQRLPQADATAINFIAPFLVMLLVGPILGETVTTARWSGAAVGFLGMLAVVRPGAALDSIGVMFVLLTVVCNVGFQLLTRKLAAVENSFTTLFLSAAIGVIASLATLPLQSVWGGWPQTLSAHQLTLLLSLGCTGAISQWCFIRAYYWSSASFIAPLVFLQLLWAVASGWWFFGQFPDAISLAGMVLILSGGIGSMWVDARAHRRGRALNLEAAVDR